MLYVQCVRPAVEDCIKYCSTMAQRLDALIFGASGFTGKYTVKELALIAKEKPITWGVAGRSEEKLKSVLEEMSKKTGVDLSSVKIVTADINDEESLKQMTAQAKVIINCCGPYRFLGEPVIKACIATATHHVDVSGEPQYMERMQLEYNKAAQDAGVYIVSACGFDSVPCDLGIVYLQDKFDGVVNSVETYLQTKAKTDVGGARIHYGTWESAVYGLAHANELRPLRTKLYPERLPQFKPKLKSLPKFCKSAIVNNAWVLPFLGADKAVASRSQRYFFDHDKKRPVQIATYFSVPSFFGVMLMGFFGMIFALLTKFNFGRYLLLKHPKLFSAGFASHEGPAEEVMQNTHFSITLVGKGWTSDKTLAEPTDQISEPLNKTVITKVSGVNPGYGFTCIALILCGMTMLKEADKMPQNGGVYPPGAAFAKTSLIQELHKHCLTFEVVSVKEE
ncbi:Saccheropin dehydrogenase 1 [Carabus blaptoides fortunei]